MRCPKCHTPLEEVASFCPNCGAPVPKKKKNPLIFVLIVLILLAVIVLGIKVLSGKGKESEDKTADKKQEQVKKDADKTADVEKKDDSTAEESDVQEPITMKISGKPDTFRPYYKIPVTSASATSVIDQEGYDNSAMMVTDEKDETSWQEGVDGSGIGEGLSLYLDREYKVKYLSFKLGNWREKKYYDGNNRPKTLKLTVGDCTKSVTFPDGQHEYWVTFSEECPASEIEATIEEVYKGNGSWDDTCIAEISIYGKED